MSLRRQTPGERSTPDALAHIDDAVEARCACGCGKRLASTGPSAWFATAECQQLFYARQTHNPAEVWNRPDAAPVYLDDARAAPLADPPQPLISRDDEREAGYDGPGDLIDALRYAYAAVQRRPGFGGFPVRRLPIPEPAGGRLDLVAVEQLFDDPGWLLANEGPVAWLRWCDRCQKAQPTRWGRRPLFPGTATFTNLVDPADIVMPLSEPCLRYSCGAPVPGPLFIAQWQKRPRLGHVLRLAAPEHGYMVTNALGFEADHLSPVEVGFLWGRMADDITYRLTYRHPCRIGGCETIGRAYFEATCRVFLQIPDPQFSYMSRSHVLPAGEWWLCPEHEYHLLRQHDHNTGQPLVEWSITP